MNVYSYFQRIPIQESDVPSKNLPLFRWSIFQLKMANLTKQKISKLCSHIYDCLQDDETLDENQYKQNLQHQIKQESLDSLFWEVIDFPLIQMIFIVLLHHIYDCVVVPMLEGKNMLLDVPIGFGFFLRIIGTYILIKVLMAYFAMQPNRGQFTFWIVLGISFFAYLSIQHYSNLWDTNPWFTIPLWVWVLYNCILLSLSVLWTKRNML